MCLDLSMKVKILNFLEHLIRKYPYELGVRKNFFNRTYNVLTIKKKTDKLDNIEIKKFCLEKTSLGELCKVKLQTEQRGFNTHPRQMVCIQKL